MWNEFDGTVFCNTNTDPLPFNVSGVVEAFNCQQSISADLNWYAASIVTYIIYTITTSCQCNENWITR